MAIFRWITFCVVIILIQIAVIHSEIHRAKASSPKSGKSRTDSYVADGMKSDSFENFSSMASLNMTGINYDVWGYSILGAALVGLSGIFPLLVIPIEAGPSLKHGAAAARLKLLLSFAVGGLLGDVFLHLLPEAWEHLDKEDHAGHVRVGLWIIGGMLSFLIIEKGFAREGEFDHLQDGVQKSQQKGKGTVTKQRSSTTKQNGVLKSQQKETDTVAKQRPAAKKKDISKSPQNDKTENNKKKDTKKIKKSKQKQSSPQSNSIDKPPKTQQIKISGYLNLAANVIDNFTHGLAVAGGFLVSSKVGLITTVAILLHEIPHEVGDFAILLRSGFDRWKAAKAQLLTATGGMVGALTALMADSAQAAGESTAWILPFTSGGFIYIALVTVVPDLLEEHRPRESVKQVLCLLGGIAVMFVVSIVH